MSPPRPPATPWLALVLLLACGPGRVVVGRDGADGGASGATASAGASAAASAGQGGAAQGGAGNAGGTAAGGAGAGGSSAGGQAGSAGGGQGGEAGAAGSAGGGALCGEPGQQAPCAPDRFCDHDDKACGRTGGASTCLPRPAPEVCPEACNPICACDGKVYCNECHANNAGADADPNGACP